MLNIGGPELLVILLVALVFLGPTRLPDAARQAGQMVTSLRSLARGFQTELEAAAKPDALTAPADQKLGDKARSVDVAGQAVTADAESRDDGPRMLADPFAPRDPEPELNDDDGDRADEEEE